MTRFILRRLMWAIPTVLLVTFVVYFAIRVGTDPVKAYQRSNTRATRRQIAVYREVNGLYEGFGGYVRGYFHWLGNFINGQWPRSIKGKRDVWPNLKRAIANSIVLGGLATVIGIMVGLLIGIVAALRPGSLRDTTATTGAFVGISVPPYVSGILLQLLFGVYLARWTGSSHFPLKLPVSGIYPPGHNGFDVVLRAKYLILPVIVVAVQIIAGYSRYMRASLLEVSQSDYLRTARAKGVSERRVLVRHALRNALIPIVTIAAVDIGGVLSGLIITEKIFDYPGAGAYFLNALGNGDFPELMPWMVIVTVVVVTFNLLADLSYAWLDPRIRLD